MSISSNGTWIYVADKEQQQEPESYIGATAPRRPMAIPVSPKELDRQQEILDYYNNKKKLEKLNEALGGAGQPSGVTQSRLVRHLRSMPSFPKHGPCYPETQVQTPTPPPVASRRRKNTSIPPPVPNPLWVPFRSATEPPPPPLHSHPSRGLLNVNTIVDSSPSKLSPSASPYSAPISSSPTFLPLSSLPPGYDFALAQFRPEANKLRPLRLLSLDGGGVRGISSLKILKDIMDRIKPGARPCDYFDLIAGTSTGGLIAIMLGRLRMSVDECILYYHRLAKQIFKRNPAAQAGSLAFVEHRFSPDNLEEAIRQVVARWSPSNTKMADHHRHCART
ncbi:Calcium-independent phospholipase A2-gamma [Rhizoctonia solani AG-1 IB]|uniref:Calcium-independent phospholipase A2-gamma n=1 Tax=Thanatephorus cucumeris (strain AG1-IB / isolate 7/3/14) TaxID=1108050 RepID=M5BXU5_THACB|nr:Calcium-independent phospholipase A2-gamma [Rhizoctonia solani AG-1 IB]